ncbi:MAG TPA: hypothetical protein VM513_35960 [Kofleriaceae bacterium]|nr:hypothetical protein [Kofleriaceae bacterium]
MKIQRARGRLGGVSWLRAVASATLVAVAVPAAAAPGSIDALAKEVAKLRGLRLKKPIASEIVDRDELRRRLRAMAEEATTRAHTAAEGFALARWGLIPLVLDYEALVIDIFTEQLVGYYDPATDTLAISKAAADDPAHAELVLAHELAHGLQDQAFDLEKFEDLPPAETDAALARRALVEGDGVALMIEVMLARQGQAAPWSAPDVAAALDTSFARPGGGDAFDRAPFAVREALLFPYRAGTSFVAALRRRQPWSAVDAVYRRPPRSTEQILHLDRYVADEAPIAVALATPAALRGFSLAHEAVWGEHGFALFLQAHGVDAGVAANAAEGWGGDRMLSLTRDADRRPERGVGIAKLVWDTEADAIEATEAAMRAVDAAVLGATFERGAERMRWLALDGTVASVERRGTTLVVVLGAPAWASAQLAAELWAP